MKEAWIASAGFALGWLTSKTVQDPGCQIGLVVFLVVAAVLLVAFAVAVTGHRPPDGPDAEGQDDKDPR